MQLCVMPETNEGKKNLKKKRNPEVFIFVFATQLNNCLLQQTIISLKG